MTPTTESTFDQALNLLQSLPLEQQDDLLLIMKQKRQSEFIEGVKEAEKDFAEGRFIRGNTKTILQALQK
jgi:hypothetical protein